jgi:hypothetical protein
LKAKNEEEKTKTKYNLHRRNAMEVFFLPKEEVFLTFKMANGSGWLTSCRLILCQHEPGYLEGQAPEFFFLQGFVKADIHDEKLTVWFEGNRHATIQLPVNSSGLLEEIKEYIEEASKNHKIH